MRKKSKIRYVILIIAVITGFTCIFTPVVQGKSTKLVFEAEAVQSDFQIQEEWWEDGVLHRRSYTENKLSGTLDGIEFTGHNELNLHIKIDFSTGVVTLNGKVTWNITWGDFPHELKGTFYGPGNYKGMIMGEFNGKITLQGAGDFNGWKLFGIVKNLPGGPIILSGTVLIPN